MDENYTTFDKSINLIGFLFGFIALLMVILIIFILL